MSDDRKLFTQQSELVLEVLNQQRHDWLNHFQVLLGYLKLNRPNQGEEYLKRVTELTFQEGMVARIRFPQLSVFLLTFNALHHDLRLEVELCNQVDFSLVDVDQDAVLRFIQQLVFTIRDNLEKSEPASLLLTLSQPGNTFRIRFDLEGSWLVSGQENVAKMVDESTKQSAAIVTEWIQSEAEWVMEVQFSPRSS